MPLQHHFIIWAPSIFVVFSQLSFQGSAVWETKSEHSGWLRDSHYCHQLPISLFTRTLELWPTKNYLKNYLMKSFKKELSSMLCIVEFQQCPAKRNILTRLKTNNQWPTPTDRQWVTAQRYEPSSQNSCSSSPNCRNHLITNMPRKKSNSH